ncbi:MAG: hypothetical protein AAF587_23770 [Bacteroidota bacterium]
MRKYVYLLIVSIALGFTMFFLATPVPSVSNSLLSSVQSVKDIPHAPKVILDSLPIKGAPLAGVVKTPKPWFQLPEIPFSPKEKAEPYMMENDDSHSELDLSILSGILGMFLSLYK